MPTLSAAEFASLRAELQKPAYAGLTDSQRFDLLHAPAAVANPTPQGQTAKPFTIAQVFGLLSAASAGKTCSVAFMPDIRDKIAANDRTACGLYANLLAAGGVITPDERAAILAVLQATQPDPGWAATVPGVSPKETLFPGASWSLADGSVVNYIPLADVTGAR